MRRKLTTTVLSSIICCGVASSAVNYEYWLDYDRTTIQSGTMNSSTIQLSPSLDGLSYGFHNFNIRLSNSEGQWGAPWQRIFFMAQPEAVKYEYWIDNDRTTVQSGPLNSSTIQFSTSLNGLYPGLHTINVRVGNAEGEWGAPWQRIFFLAQQEAVKYEYWLDNDRTTVHSGPLNSSTIQFAPQLDGLYPGLHTFNVRVGNAEGEWGAPWQRTFLLSRSNQGAVKYEYWLDKDYANKKTGNLDSGSSNFTVDVENLYNGLHSFHYRMANADDEWGAPMTSYFFVKSNAGDAASYEYWIDNNYAGKVTGNVTGKNLALNVDLNESVLSNTLHSFNLRLQDKKGQYGSVYHKLFVIKDDSLTNVKGYKHFLNGKELGYENLPANTFESGKHTFTVDIPEGFGTSLTDRQLTFRADEVVANATDSLTYTLMIESKAGWSAPSDWKIAGAPELHASVTKMEMNKAYELQKPDYGEFSAISYISNGMQLSLSYDHPMKMHIFRISESDGNVDSFPYELIKTLDLDYEIQDSVGYTGSLKQTFVPCDEGTYYALIQSVPKDSIFKKDNFSVIMNQVTDMITAPNITFENGIVSITHNDKDALIYYGINTSDTTELELYSEPFGIDGNCTIYAQARKEGMFDSVVSSLEITSFTVANPEIEINNLEVVITEDDTEGVKTYYTLDGSDPTEESSVYTTPFSLDADATVMARSFKANYNPSEIVTFVYKHEDYVCVKPTISIEGNKVILTTTTEDAQIYYGIDNDDTVAMSLYTVPFELSSNSTVYAQARKYGMYDSDVASLTVSSLTVADPMITFNNLDIVITGDNAEGVKTYYTLDGTDPTEESTLYTGPFRLSGNTTVKARSFKAGYNPSRITSFTYEHSVYISAKPTITVNGTMVTLSTTTDNAQIYYGIDNDDTTAMTLYTVPFELIGNQTIYAQTRKNGMYDSEVASLTVSSFTVANPVITIDNLDVVITGDNNEGVKTYYTLDGSDPTEESSLYSAPFRLSADATIKARSFKTGYNPSGIAVFAYEHSSYVVAKPTISADGFTITLATVTPEAQIYYGIDNDDTTAMTLYNAPFDVSGNCTIYVQARKTGLYDSEVASLVLDFYSCKATNFSYDGRYVALSTEESGAEIYYSLDSADDWIPYTGKFDLGGLHEVVTKVSQTGLHDNISSFSVSGYADESHAELAQSGELNQLFGWADSSTLNSIEKFAITGELANADIVWLKSLGNIRQLDLSEANMADQISSGALDMPELLSIAMPASEFAMADNIFGNANSTLCAIKLPASDGLPANLLTGVLNPNLLLYTGATRAGEFDAVHNVISGGIAEDILLTDGYPFFAPEEFTAQRISYTRFFSKITEIGECSGWETITLPFDVESVSDANGQILPFAASSDESRRFWLYEPNASGWSKSAAIAAYNPYIISMPNHPWYDDDYNISGDVTFSASQAIVAATAEPVGSPYRNGSAMWPTFRTIHAHSGIWTINDEETDGNIAGSVFVEAQRDVRPFECYITDVTTMRDLVTRSANSYFPIYGLDDSDGISAATGFKVWGEGRDICITSDVRLHLPVYDTVGHIIRIADVEPGKICRVSGLAPGIYISGKTKIMLK